MGSKLELALLGSPRITLDGEPVTTFRTAKAQALLYYLAVTGLPWSRSSLAGMLWGDMSESNARRNLSKSLSELRHIVRDHIRIDSREVEFDQQSDFWLDVVSLQAVLRQIDDSADDAQFGQAANLVRGEFLQGFDVHNAPDFETWMLTERAQYRRQAIRLFEAMAAQCRKNGELSRAIRLSRQILVLEPWREETYQQLILLLAEDGQRSAALVLYDACRKALDDEFGVAPSQETEALVQTIRDGTAARFQRTIGGLATDPIGERSFSADRLPLETTPFIGRVEELASILRRLHDPTCRLLTLAGPGGIGKSRLSLEAARLLIHEQGPANQFQDGIYFVPLSTVQSFNGIAIAAAQIMGYQLHDHEAPAQGLLDLLQNKRILLILDNFEHLRSHVGLISDILNASTFVKVLVTSRIGLNIDEEWFHAVAGLSVPPPPGEKMAREPADAAAYDAVRLFEQRARRSLANFSLAEQQEHVVKICRLVEGTPLAIELAAAWLKALPTWRVAEEIAHNLDILVSRNQNIPERHRSMRVVLDQTWHLLSSDERSVFKRLAVFQGGFDQDAASAVASASLLTLTSLVEHCLLRITADGRYQVHELLRQYAMEELRNIDDDYLLQRDRHSAYFAQFADARFQEIDAGDRQMTVLAEVAIEWENLTAAWFWSSDRMNVDNVSKMTGVVCSYCLYRGRLLEGADMAQQGVEVFHNVEPSPKSDAAFAKLLNLQGWLTVRLGQTQKAGDVFAHSHELYERLGIPYPATVATDSKLGLGVIANIRGQYADAEAYGEASRQQATLIGDKKNLQYACYILANAAYAQGDYRKAQRFAQQAYTLSREVKQHTDRCYFLDHLGEIATVLGDYEEAQEYYRECYTLQEALENPEGMADALNHQGEAVFAQGRVGDAERLFQRAQTIHSNIGNRGGIATSLYSLGRLASARGDYTGAISQYALALEICAAIDYAPLTLNIFTDCGEALFCLERAAEGADLLQLVISHPASQRPTRDRAESLLRQHSDVITMPDTTLDKPENSADLAETSRKFIRLVEQIGCDTRI